MKKKVFVNKYFDYIYCLNLERRQDRWRSMSKWLKRYGVIANRFSAIDGNTEENVEKYRQIKSKFKTSSKKLGEKTIRSPGALGCLLSHRAIIEHAKKNGYKRILILEDDAMLSKHFNKQFKNKIRMIDDWKLLYLGASQHDWSGVKLTGLPFYKAWCSQGTFALAIDYSIFDEILAITKDLNIPFDSFLSTTIQKKYKNKCFVFYPNVVISDVSNSDIREGVENVREHAGLLRWDLTKYCLHDADAFCGEKR